MVQMVTVAVLLLLTRLMLKYNKYIPALPSTAQCSAAVNLFLHGY